MLERIRQIPKRIIEMWNKLTKRQKIITVSSVGAVIITLVILIILLNRITYEPFATYDDTETARAVMDVLSENNIANKIEDDLLTVDVDVTKKTEAGLAIAGNADLSDASMMTLEQLLDNDLSTTNSDKALKNNLYYIGKLEKGIKETIAGVDDVQIFYIYEDSSNNILQQAKEVSCSVILTINEYFDIKKTPEALATVVAHAIGNTTTEKIKIIDQTGILLFGDDKENDDEEILNQNLAYKKLVEKWYKDKMYELAIKNGFADAEVVPSLSVNCDKESILYTEYLAGEGLEQGLYDTYKKVSSESTGNAGDIPGTDSNDETDYYIQTSGTGNSSYEELSIKYKPSERVTETVKEWGVIDNAASSLGVVLTRPITRTQEELELLGLLEDTTFEEYVANHSERTRVDIPEDYYSLFSDASGIPEGNITIIGYETYKYVPRAEVESNISLLLEILLAVLIIGLLVFVVFRAMKPEEIIETEPELSVERLLATTRPDQSLEDIEFGEKSETRKLIEKYIDENPESVAALLRNWLSDDGWE